MNNWWNEMERTFPDFHCPKEYDKKYSIFFALTQSVSLSNFAVQDEFVEECDSRQLDAIFLAKQNLIEAEAVLGYADGIVIQGHIKFR